MSGMKILSATALVFALAVPHTASAGQGRPDPNALPVPPGGTREQILKEVFTDDQLTQIYAFPSSIQSNEQAGPIGSV